MKLTTSNLLTVALVVLTGAAVVSAACTVLAALTLYEAAHALLEITARSLEESS